MMGCRCTVDLYLDLVLNLNFGDRIGDAGSHPPHIASYAYIIEENTPLLILHHLDRTRCLNI